MNDVVWMFRWQICGLYLGSICLSMVRFNNEKQMKMYYVFVLFCFVFYWIFFLMDMIVFYFKKINYIKYIRNRGDQTNTIWKQLKKSCHSHTHTHTHATIDIKQKKNDLIIKNKTNWNIGNIGEFCSQRYISICILLYIDWLIAIESTISF